MKEGSTFSLFSVTERSHSAKKNERENMQLTHKITTKEDKKIQLGRDIHHVETKTDFRKIIA